MLPIRCCFLLLAMICFTCTVRVWFWLFIHISFRYVLKSFLSCFDCSISVLFFFFLNKICPVIRIPLSSLTVVKYLTNKTRNNFDDMLKQLHPIRTTSTKGLNQIMSDGFGLSAPKKYFVRPTPFRIDHEDYSTEENCVLLLLVLVLVLFSLALFKSFPYPSSLWNWNTSRVLQDSTLCCCCNLVWHSVQR